MIKSKKTGFCYGLVLLLLLLMASEVKAKNNFQEATPVPGTATLVPTLPVELYSMTATPGLDGGIRHVVLDGQFLYNIVDLYGVSLNEILTLNNLTEDSIIHPGDILVIVKGGELTLGEGTLTPEVTMTETTPTATATVDLVTQLVLPQEMTPQVTAEPAGFFERVFSSNARFLALGVLALVVFGVVLLIISSRRIQ